MNMDKNRDEDVPLMQRTVGELETLLNDCKSWGRVGSWEKASGGYTVRDTRGEAWYGVDENGLHPDGMYVVRLRTTDTPTLDEWESAIEGETLVQIVQLIAPTEHDHTQIVELRQGAGCSKVWVTNSYGNSFGASIIRRKPQTTTLNFDRQSFSAVGAQFIALGKPGEQPPKESVWIRGDIDEVGIFFNDSSRRVHMSWSELAAKWVYTSDHGATWHACNRTVTKGA
jgi:hypothetical protein